MVVVEQIAGEPISSFDAIQWYYNIGKGRTVHKAYTAYIDTEGLEFNNAELQSWMLWAETYHWVNRVKDKEKELEERANLYNTQDQVNDLVKFRKRQGALGIQLADTTQLLLSKAQEALMHLDPLTISPGTLPKYIEAAAKISQMAQNAEAQVLALSDLIQQLENQDTDDGFDFNDDEDAEFEIELT